MKDLTVSFIIERLLWILECESKPLFSFWTIWAIPVFDIVHCCTVATWQAVVWHEREFCWRVNNQGVLFCLISLSLHHFDEHCFLRVYALLNSLLAISLSWFVFTFNFLAFELGLRVVLIGWMKSVLLAVISRANLLFESKITNLLKLFYIDRLVRVFRLCCNNMLTISGSPNRTSGWN